MSTLLPSNELLLVDGDQEADGLAGQLRREHASAVDAFRAAVRAVDTATARHADEDASRHAQRLGAAHKGEVLELIDLEALAIGRQVEVERLWQHVTECIPSVASARARLKQMVLVLAQKEGARLRAAEDRVRETAPPNFVMAAYFPDEQRLAVKPVSLAEAMDALPQPEVTREDLENVGAIARGGGVEETRLRHWADEQARGANATRGGAAPTPEQALERQAARRVAQDPALTYEQALERRAAQRRPTSDAPMHQLHTPHK